MNLGKRSRKTIIHIDNLSEQMFIKAVEEGQDLQEVIKEDNEKRERRAQDSFSEQDEELGDFSYSKGKKREKKHNFTESKKQESALDHKRRKTEGWQTGTQRQEEDLVRMAAEGQQSDIIQDNFPSEE